MIVKTNPEVEVQKIFDHHDRITPELFKELTTFLYKKGYRIASAKTKRTAMPKVPIHRPVVMRVPIKIVTNDDVGMREIDMFFELEDINEGT